MPHIETLRFGDILVDRRNREAEPIYCVSLRGEVWNESRQGFEYEPNPSARTDRFKQETRYSLMEAVRLAQWLQAEMGAGRTFSDLEIK